SWRAHSAGKAMGDPILQMRANMNLGLNAYTAGDYRRAEGFYVNILQLVPSDQLRERFGFALLPAVNARSNLAAALAQRGVFEEGVRHGQVAIELAEAVGHPYSLAVAGWRVGGMYTVRGDLAQARPILSQARSLAAELTIGFLIPGVALELSALSVLEGRGQDALSLVAEARAAIEQVGLGWWEGLAELRCGEALFAAGQVDEARVVATRAFDLARERREQGHQAWALRLLGELAARSGSHEADSHYRQALVLAERLDMRPLVAHCHLGLGHLSRRVNQLPDAREHVTAATTMYREMAMPYWLEQAEAAMSTLG
ncbi:MAG TPA: hypothetical protein VLD61_06615, partial [Methylomirabilota bacterium]|nr:hypothetical protein [Methylomirabilota bacterium]